ncbi:26S proteasome non-ATPase regulatory subunit 1A [Dorcoceras hygrometricum]|uniref:26S proteasome non-ATPase regulatory subunit 1A n=1 Tax=Dorcoceras hygrometricum TaxID=472368 RepID=A0A2Z7BG40_9LAMI|nr:26S proteasome non-ATPase regulatory subunit 1A [Dorcoceras hygrometricum]
MLCIMSCKCMSGTKNIGNNRRAKRIGNNNCDTSLSLGSYPMHPVENRVAHRRTCAEATRQVARNFKWKQPPTNLYPAHNSLQKGYRMKELLKRGPTLSQMYQTVTENDGKCRRNATVNTKRRRLRYCDWYQLQGVMRLDDQSRNKSLVISVFLVSGEIRQRFEERHCSLRLVVFRILRLPCDWYLARCCDWIMTSVERRRLSKLQRCVLRLRLDDQQLVYRIVYPVRHRLSKLVRRRFENQSLVYFSDCWRNQPLVLASAG